MCGEGRRSLNDNGYRRCCPAKPKRRHYPVPMYAKDGFRQPNRILHWQNGCQDRNFPPTLWFLNGMRRRDFQRPGRGRIITVHFFYNL